MKIAVDVMGGDYAPRELVKGAVKYLQGGKAGLILVGDESAIRPEMPELPANCEIVHTSEFVEMGEPPAQALRKKKNASVALAARLVKEGRANAFLSAGSTGAQMAASLLEIGRIPGIERPAVAVLLPTRSEKGVMVLDVGANVDCKPTHLVQFALMGSAYYQKICNCNTPAVAILNIGSESSKGNDLTKAAYEMFQKLDCINFVGNIESDNMFSGDVQVVVCDGFVGNVLLKTSEGVAEMIMSSLKQGIAKAASNPEVASTIGACIKRYQPDSPEYSAAPLLGIGGVSVVCHGKTKASGIADALHLAAKYAGTDVLGLIRSDLETARSVPG